MRELEPEPLLKVNATDAAERGIQQGDYVRVYNDPAMPCSRRV